MNKPSFFQYPRDQASGRRGLQLRHHNDHGAAVVPRLSACAGRDGTLARLGRTDGLAPPIGRIGQGAVPRLLAACDAGTVAGNRDLTIFVQEAASLRLDGFYRHTCEKFGAEQA